MNLLDKLHRQVKVSDLDFPSLPLCNFHIVIVSEPDPETWMAHPDDKDEFAQILQIHSELIFDEMVRDFDISEIKVDIADDVDGELLVAVGEYEVPLYYYLAIEFAQAVFSFENVKYDKLSYFMNGIVQKHPDWRVAVVGGVYEDEVVRVANTVQEAGLDTTIVARYCISSQSLINLDELFASITPEQYRRIQKEREEVLGIEDMDEDSPGE